MPAPATELATVRLQLRLVMPDDAAALLPLLDDWDVVRMLAQKPWPVTLADTQDYAARQYGADAEGEDFAVVGADGQVIGVVAVKAPGTGKPPRTMPRLGYWFGRRYWGQGYAAEAIRAVTADVFHRFAVERVGAGVFRDNPASKRLLEKLGFEEVGGYDTFCLARGAGVPTSDMNLTRQKFESIGS